jgi:endonuclease/exonuclease/phosphatase family metal-dependent hydrolase
MRRHSVFIAAAFAIVAGCATGARQEARLRAMTYNIRLDTEADGPNAWPYRREAVSALTRFYDPDIVGMQEVRVHQLRQLQEDLGDYVFLGVSRDDGEEGGEFSPLAFDGGRFSLVDNGTFWLSETPMRPSKSWDAAFPRLVTWARLQEKVSGGRILALNTHWDHLGVEARLESGRMIRDWITESRAPCETVVLLGDFNATPDEPSYQALTGAGALRPAKDISETPPFGPPGTFNGFDIMRAAAAPIDHILVSEGVRVFRYGVITQHSEGRLPSDHYPVLADFAPAACRRS